MTGAAAAPRPTWTVRALDGARERDAYFALAASTFPGYQRVHGAAQVGADVAAGWRLFVEDMPTYAPGQVRGAFDGERLLGGYLHEERRLRVGGVPLLSGYVGGVVTDAEQRGRGIGSALMRDAVARAEQRGQALIVLRGISDYYGRFGYADVMELVEHNVAASAVRALPAPDYRVRPARLEDAAALLDLHTRHFLAYTGSYARTLAQQEHFLRHRAVPPLLALDARGRPRGYLLLPGGPDPLAAVEVAADEWPAALTLLRHHAGLVGEGDELRWPLPLDSVTYYLLADHLPLRSESRSRPDAGFMARVGDAAALFEGLVPVWQARWRRGGAVGQGTIVLDVDGARCCLELADRELRRLETGPSGRTALRLTPQALVQLVFGYRPVSHLVGEAPAALDVLFPSGTAWYPASNRC